VPITLCKRNDCTYLLKKKSLPRNLDSPNHQAHVAYPSSWTFESGGPCQGTHPVQIPQLFFEIIWDTRKSNDKSMWPQDGKPPFLLPGVLVTSRHTLDLLLFFQSKGLK
jgi:hypothetical protein